MFFNKFPHRANYSFAKNFDAKQNTLETGALACETEIDAFAGDLYRIRVHSKRFVKQRQLAELTIPAPAALTKLKVGPNFEFSLPGLLCSAEEQAFGVSGSRYLFQFDVDASTQYFGMGEKTFGRMELSGLRSRFWNTDVWSDFHFAQWLDHPADPPYLSVPYVIVKQGDSFVGLLLNTPWPTFVETPGSEGQRVFVEWQRTSPYLTIGAEGGTPELWIIVGPTLKELTQKLQKLVGVTPLPPAWALGYHQSRWEYGTEKDLLELDHQFEAHKIPCDGLWLDIEYMDGFRVFSHNSENFPNGIASVASKLKKNNRKMVPILDPGVKHEAGYSVFDDGAAKNVFCKNAEGNWYTGLVWPGETVFPDFTLGAAQKWWAGYVKSFAQSGFDAAWIDMNDPSTGPVDPSDMLFNRGREPHAMHRNEYALGMQKATFEGFRQARPKLRPFVLSRSGSIGTSRYSAVWTGDNVANYFYLKTSIPTTLNLSLSGIPFNGPDCGGFGGDPTDQLMLDWFKAGFLFPFLRNHSIKESRNREPWNFSPATAKALRKYIRLRYKFLPYLYNLFIEQETNGAPILRPLMYEFAGAGLELVSDQFLVGPDLMQAPILDAEVRSRNVHLPGDSWFDANGGEWLPAGQIYAAPGKGETLLFMRNGAVVPMAVGLPTTNRKNFSKVEIHLFIDPTSAGRATYSYRADDGETLAYRSGKRSELRIDAVWDSNRLNLQTKVTADGFGSIEATYFIHGGPPEITLNGARATTESAKLTLTGRAIVCRRVS